MGAMKGPRGELSERESGWGGWGIWFRGGAAAEELMEGGVPNEDVTSGDEDMTEGDASVEGIGTAAGLELYCGAETE